MRATLPALLLFTQFTLVPRLSAQSAPPEFPPILPEWKLDTLAADDGTFHRCLVFATQPGVLYTVEHSPDLVTWTADSTIYGLGHQFATALIRTTAPADLPPSGGLPPPPGSGRRLVSLRLAPSAAAEGGTVVSWPSLETGREARVALIPETLVPAWAFMPLYVEGFGNHLFFIACTSRTTEPPAEDPELGAEDAAMLTALRDNLPAINQQVSESLARATNSPPPAPADPNSRRFWRIKVDRGLDSDDDGTPDWLEFLAADGPTPDAMADAFIRDVDRNGEKDGYQVDSDRDGLPDVLDPDPTDSDIGTADPATRFAVFHIGARAGPDGTAIPTLMINSGGIVLYPDAWWQRGVVTTLQTEHPGEVGSCRALAINDANRILGIGSAERLPSPDTPETAGGTAGSYGVAPSPLIHCWWSAPGALPVPVEARGKFAEPVERVSDSVATLATDDPFPFDSLLSGTSQFMADSANDTDPAVMTRELWGAEGDGFTRTAGEGNLYSRDGFDPVFARMGVTGLNIYGRFNGGSRLLAPASGQHDFGMDLRRLRLTITETEVFEVACGPGAGTEAYRATRWRPSSALSNATDIIDNSLRLTRLPAEGFTPARDGVAQDLRFYPWPWWAPGLAHPAVSPANVNLADTGWALRRLEGGGAQAAMPVSFDDADASGTDTESLRGFPWRLDFGSQEKCWVMVPMGGPPNTFAFRSLAMSGNVLRVTAPGMNWSAGGEMMETGSPTVTESLSMPASSQTASGSEIDLLINLGTPGGAKVNSISFPLAGYVMKERVVRVRPFRVIKLTGETENAPDLHIPTTALKAHLDAIFEPQINVTFEVMPTVDLRMDWDKAVDGVKDGILDLDNEVDEMLEETKNTADDIRLFLLGTDHVPVATDAGGRGPCHGLASRPLFNPSGVPDSSPNVCWVLAEPLEGRTIEHLKGTIAHEIGHVLVGFGHPDDRKFFGPARLPKTDHRKRLMASAYEVMGAVRTGTMLVKKEWEAAEQWLKKFIDKEEPTPP